MDQTTIELINMLSIGTLLKLKNQCEKYITYTIDFKQVNNKNRIQARQKLFAEILEQVQATLVFKQVENEKANSAEKSENIKSTMQPETVEGNTQKADKKKESKK